jgi:hypothetical protein
MTVIARLPALLSEHRLPPRFVATLFKYFNDQIVGIEKEIIRQLEDDDLGQRFLCI